MWNLRGAGAKSHHRFSSSRLGSQEGAEGVFYEAGMTMYDMNVWRNNPLQHVLTLSKNLLDEDSRPDGQQKALVNQ